MLQSKQVAGKLPLPEPCGGVEPVIAMGEYVIGAALPLNSVIEMTGIPAGTFVTDFTLVADDADSNATPTIAFQVGVLSGLYGQNNDARTIGTEFANAGTTTMQAGGVLQNPKKDGLMLVPANVDRGVGIKITAAAATLTAGARIRVYLTCVSDPGNLS